MRKSMLLLLSGLLVAALPLTAEAAKRKTAAAPPAPAPSFVGAGLHQFVVPFESMAKAAEPAAPAKAKKVSHRKHKAHTKKSRKGKVTKKKKG
jgi:hypothetical protein